MKKLYLAVTGLSLLLGAGSAFADLKVGVVDLQKVLTTSPQVIAARNSLVAKFDPTKKEIAAQQKTLRDDFDKLSKNKAVMKDEERKTLEAKIDDEQKKLRTVAMDFEQKFGQEEEKTMQEVTKKIQVVVDKFAAEQKYDLIIAKGATAYNNPSFDVTDKVIAALKAAK